MPTLEELVDALVRDRQNVTDFPALQLTSNGSFQDTNATMAVVSNMTGIQDPSPGIPPIVVRSLIVLIFACFISGITIILRVATRWARLKTLTSDDILIIFAWLLSGATGIVSHWRDARGFGDAMPTPTDLSHIFLQQFILMQLFYVTLATVQISVAINYRRFTANLSKRHVRLCNAVFIYVVVGSLLETLCYIFQCSPVSAFWTLANDRSRCYSPGTSIVLITYGPPLFRISADLAFIAIPMPIIMNLTLPKSQKGAVAAVVCVTFLSIAANLQRLVLTRPAPQISVEQFLTTVLPEIQMWSNIEVGSAIVCACAVTLRGPFIVFWHTMTHSRRQRQVTTTRTQNNMKDVELAIVTQTVLIDRPRMGSQSSESTLRDAQTGELSKIDNTSLQDIVNIPPTHKDNLNLNLDDDQDGLCFREMIQSGGQ